MSLYDMMNARVYARKPDKRGGMMDAKVYNTVPTATEEKAPTPKEYKVYPVHDAEAIKAASPVMEPAEPQKKPYTWWWQTPDYLGEVERRAADADKQAEMEKKRLRRERNAAIISDIAKLAAQAFMLKGGVTNIERFTPQSQVVNDKIASLSEKRAAQIAAFAKERAAARAALVADNNARMKLEMSLAADDAERKAKAERDADNRAWDVYKQKTLEDHRAAELEYRKKREERLAEQGNGKNKGLIVTFPNGNRVEYSDDIQGDGSIYEAYEDLKAAGMRPLMSKKWDGEQWVDTDIEETNPAKIRAHIKREMKSGYKTATTSPIANKNAKKQNLTQGEGGY